jgi:hypothetical protein
LVGTGDAAVCTNEVNRLIPNHSEPTDEIKESRTVGGVKHPPIRGHFFAMSLFFFTLDCLRELSKHQGLNESWPTPSIADLTHALDMLCSRDWEDVSLHTRPLNVRQLPNISDILPYTNLSLAFHRILLKFKTMRMNSLDHLFYQIDASKAYTW